MSVRRFGGLLFLGLALGGCNLIFPYSSGDSRSAPADVPGRQDQMGSDGRSWDARTHDGAADAVASDRATTNDYPELDGRHDYPPLDGTSRDRAGEPPRPPDAGPSDPGNTQEGIFLPDAFVWPDACPVCLLPQVQCCRCYPCEPKGTVCPAIVCPN
jgi:hypothetical protein